MESVNTCSVMTTLHELHVYTVTHYQPVTRTQKGGRRFVRVGESEELAWRCADCGRGGAPVAGGENTSGEGGEVCVMYRAASL